jgi:ABC-type phosphate transport system substrate-binding protein
MEGQARRLKGLIALGCGCLLAAAVASAPADVVVVVSAQNPTESLPRAVLTDIYLGRRSVLPDGVPVVPIDQRETTPCYHEFYDRYLGRTQAEIRAHWSKLIFTGRGRPPQTVADGQAAALLIAGNPNAIGYVDSDLVDESLRVLVID